MGGCDGEDGRLKKEGGKDVPVSPIKPSAMVLCATSAHLLPRTTVLSHNERGLSFSAARRARRRATFCCGVSL